MNNERLGGLEGPLREFLRHWNLYKKTQQEINEFVQSLVSQVADRKYLEGEYIQTLLQDAELAPAAAAAEGIAHSPHVSSTFFCRWLLVLLQLHTRCLTAYNCRLLQQQATLERMHMQLESLVSGMYEAALTCRAFSSSRGSAASACVAANTTSRGEQDLYEAAMAAADAAGLLEMVSTACKRQLALQQRLLSILHDLKPTDTREMQRFLLLFNTRPCEYPLQKTGMIAAAESSLKLLLEKRK
ncbi:hypothetical protein cyc_08439 [Cyclospora cayetanensis]|uniref:Uncharacterized protein n=1 Tax=Cyclospora cayetanensis TaxID=88456 RepID=A0A1D3CVZ6_9EIME|nr:hypothetical protein cyc_08439 [Cyclospora cayetanensis]